MGWNAYATESNELIGEDQQLDVVLSSPEAFARLENRSSLHGGQFRLILEAAAGKDCYSDWTAETVRYLAKSADWSLPRKFLQDIPNVWTFWDEDEFWDMFETAKLFLEICASHDLGVHFCF